MRKSGYPENVAVAASMKNARQSRSTAGHGRKRKKSKKPQQFGKHVRHASNAPQGEKANLDAKTKRAEHGGSLKRPHLRGSDPIHKDI